MKKSYLIAVIVLVLVLSFGVFFINGKKTTNNEVAKPTQNNVSQSFKDLFDLGKIQKCSFDRGTIFMANGKVRGDFSENSHMIVDGTISYIWTDDQKTGIKTTFDLSATPNPEGSTNFDYNQKGDYKCEDWDEDTSVFDLPKGVSFQDMSKLINPVRPASDSNSAQ